MLLFFTIPVFVVVDQPLAFFVVNSFVFIFRIYYLISKFKKMPVKNRMFKTAMTIIWVVHHFTFLLFSVVDNLIAEELIEIQDISRATVICGIIILLTLVLGCLIDLLELLVDLLIYLAKLLKKIYRKCIKNKNKVKDKHCNQAKRRQK